VVAEKGDWPAWGNVARAFFLEQLVSAEMATEIYDKEQRFEARLCHQEEIPMKRTWTIIGVADVARSCRWYQSLFGQPESAPAHDYFGQILDSDGTVLLCLHAWGAHEHPTLSSPQRAEPGNGLLLFFRVDDFEQALVRARALVDRLEEEPSTNPATGTLEFALRDPDGYYVMVSANDPV
jgi:catechol 2,3-dioxygenase-like lactoylglutathione lyase family enzyme